MNKKLLVIFLFVVLVFAAAFFVSISQKNEPKACFENKCFFIEIATTDDEKVKGLSFREGLSIDEGMLFPFSEEGNYGFWMKNMQFPLDIIWINSNMEVVYIEENLQPCLNECITFLPEEKAQFVLEVNSGMANKIKLKVGDKIYFRA